MTMGSGVERLAVLALVSVIFGCDGLPVPGADGGTGDDGVGDDAGTAACPGGCGAGNSCCDGECLPISADVDSCGTCGEAVTCGPAPSGAIRTCAAGTCASTPCADGSEAIGDVCEVVPVVILSETPGGPAQTTLSAQLTLYGRILGLAADNAQACVEVVGATDGACADLAAWTTLPNADWSFDAGSSQWRAAVAGNTYPAGMYRMFQRNSTTGAAIEPWVLTLTTCNWSAVVAGPVTPPADACGPGNEGSTTMASGYTWTCVCP